MRLATQGGNNRVRRQLLELRHTGYAAPGGPLPALEMLVAQMLAIHFCSDREESLAVLATLTEEACRRAQARQFVIEEATLRVTCAWQSGVCLDLDCLIPPSPHVLVVRWQLTGWNARTRTGHEVPPVRFSLYRWDGALRIFPAWPRTLEAHFEDFRAEVQPNGMFHWPMHGFYLSERVGTAAMISEFLLQSVDNVIRVFPCWPEEKDPKFTHLRAQGGFLVSAKQKAGKIMKLEITSTVGGKLRVLHPGTGKLVEHETQPAETAEIRP